MIKRLIRSQINKLGYDILKLPSDPAARQRIRLMNDHAINYVCDVGANSGQFGSNLRTYGYSGTIFSLEPLPNAFLSLKKKLENDLLWTAKNIAAGDVSGEISLNISRNSFSSSVLPMLPVHLNSAPDTEYIDRITVPIRRLDELLRNELHESDILLVKIDTQGFEKQVIEGCHDIMHRIIGFQLEMSLAPMYEGELPAHEMISWMKSLGYNLLSVESGHYDYKTGEILQLEGVFYKR